jgi:predicted nucleotidyltransferase
MSDNLQTIQDQLVSWAQAQPEILALYLYGSHAEGRASALSDIDVAVLVGEELSVHEMWRLEDRWTAHWPEAVDLRLLNLAPISFRYEVSTRGRRLWTADPVRVAGLESRIWRTHWDLQPMLEQAWQRHVEHLMEGRDEPERGEYQAALEKVREAATRYRPDLRE